MTALSDRTQTRAPAWGAVHIAALLAALIFGLAAGWVLSGDDSAETEFDADVAELVEDYRDAWDRGDGDAVIALMTDDGVHTCPLGTFAVDDDGGAALIRSVESMADDEFVLMSDPIVARSEAPTEASVYLSITTGTTDHPGLAEYLIVEQDGVLRIAESVFTHF